MNDIEWTTEEKKKPIDEIDFEINNTYRVCSAIVIARFVASASSLKQTDLVRKKNDSNH